MAHQKLLSSLGTKFVSAILLALAFSAPAFALDFTPGKWKVTNWIESPDGRQAMKESSIECFTENNFLPFRCDKPDCEKVDFQAFGNNVAFVYKMKNAENSLKIKGNFNYKGNIFDGVMYYFDSKTPPGSIKVMMHGERIGECDN